MAGGGFAGKRTKLQEYILWRREAGYPGFRKRSYQNKLDGLKAAKNYSYCATMSMYTRAWPATDLWPRHIKFVLTASAVGIATIVELPESFNAPGKPFLLYFIISTLCALAFGHRFGLFAIAASSVQSVLFFDPVYTVWLSNQKEPA